MYAISNGLAAEVSRPGEQGACPLCGTAVIAKAGQIVTWHWAHEARDDCDPWAEPDSSWHRGWQGAVPPGRREVVMGGHRADLVTADGTVVELQHSSIPPAEITGREDHYGRMAWLFDAREAVDDDRLLLRRKGYRHPPPGAVAGCSFRWKHPRKSIAWCKRPVLLDAGGGQVLSLSRFYCDGPPYGGWGWLYEEDYVRRWMGGGVQQDV